jgi:glycosyltransferase involved in cell wall biosynthesis
VGYFTGEKSPGLIRDVARLLADELPGAQLVCVGPAPEDQFKDVSNVVLAGTVQDAHRYYAAFDCYVSLSRKEGLGTALLDAVVRDIPTVATDAGGTRDIYPDGWEFVTREAGAVAARIGRDESVERARRAGEHARQEFSVGHMVDSVAAVYRTLTG